jgi:hypothetical protein
MALLAGSVIALHYVLHRHPVMVAFLGVSLFVHSIFVRGSQITVRLGLSLALPFFACWIPIDNAPIVSPSRCFRSSPCSCFPHLFAFGIYLLSSWVSKWASGGAADRPAVFSSSPLGPYQEMPAMEQFVSLRKPIPWDAIGKQYDFMTFS